MGRQEVIGSGGKTYFISCCQATFEFGNMGKYYYYFFIIDVDHLKNSFIEFITILKFLFFMFWFFGMRFAGS